MSEGILPMPTTVVHSGFTLPTFSAYTDGGVEADKVPCRDLSLGIRGVRQNRTGSVDNHQDIVITVIDDPDEDWRDYIGIDGSMITTYPKKVPASASGAIWTRANTELYLVGEQALEDVDGQEEVTRELTFMVNAVAVITPEA